MNQNRIPEYQNHPTVSRYNNYTSIKDHNEFHRSASATAQAYSHTNNDNGQASKTSSCYERRITDPVFSVCLLLLGFICIFIVSTAVVRGSFGRAANNVDFNGVVCGGLKPYLYVPLDPSSNTGAPNLLWSRRKCVKSCPAEKDVSDKLVIPVTKTQIDRNQDGSSATLLEYTGIIYIYAWLNINVCISIHVYNPVV